MAYPGQNKKSIKVRTRGRKVTANLTQKDKNVRKTNPSVKQQRLTKRLERGRGSTDDRLYTRIRTKRRPNYLVASTKNRIGKPRTKLSERKMNNPNITRTKDCSCQYYDWWGGSKAYKCFLSDESDRCCTQTQCSNWHGETNWEQCVAQQWNCPKTQGEK